MDPYEERGTQNKLLRQDERDKENTEQFGFTGPETCEQKSMQNGTDEPIYRKGMETENRLRTQRGKGEGAETLRAVALTCTHYGCVKEIASTGPSLPLRDGLEEWGGGGEERAQKRATCI